MERCALRITDMRMKWVYLFSGRVRLLLLFLSLTGASGFSGPVFAGALPDTFFEQADSFFQTHVRDGLVDYGALAKNPAGLRSLLQTVGSADLKDAPAAGKKAFYINAYNLLVIGAVMDHYPLQSVKDVPGFFDERTFAVAGERLTLNELENRKLRKPFKDPLLHFVLVCAAKGCPALIPAAYRPDALDQQLTVQTRRAMNDPSFTQVNSAQKQVLVSEIFKWYGQDFPSSPQGVLSFINSYRTAKIPGDYQIKYYPYDWSLNAYQGK